MPVVRVPDGRLVNFPDDMPREQIRAIIASKFPDAYKEQEIPPPTPIERTFSGQVGELFRGIPRGAVNLLESAGIGASALLPEGAEESVRGVVERLGESAAAPFQRKAGYEDSMAGTFGEAVGSFVPFLAAGPLGVAGRVGATGLAGAAGAGQARTRAEAGEATPEERAQATALGSVVGLSEVLIPFRILDNAIGAVPASGVVNRLKRAAQAGGEEGAQEVAAEVAQNLIARGIYDPEQGAFTGTGESFGYGAGVGGLVQGLMDLFVKDRGGAPAPQPAPEEEGDETTLVGTEQGPSIFEGEDLFPAELETALAQAPRPERPLAAEPSVEEARPTSDMMGDLVDIAETEEIQDLLDEEELARMQEQEDLELAKAQATRAGAQNIVDDIERQLEANRAQAAMLARRREESKQKRQEILAPVLAREDITDVENIGRAFSAELRRQGFANTEPTKDELAQITSRSYQLEEAALTGIEQENARRAGVSELEALIPEKKPKPQAVSTTTTPVDTSNRDRLDRTGRGASGQLEIPAVERASKAERRVAAITKEELDAAGVPANAPIRRRVQGVPLTTTETAAQVQQDLLSFAANPVVQERTPEVAAQVETLAQTVTETVAPAPVTETVEETVAPAAQKTRGRKPGVPLTPEQIAERAERNKSVNAKQTAQARATERLLADLEADNISKVLSQKAYSPYFPTVEDFESYKKSATDEKASREQFDTETKAKFIELRLSGMDTRRAEKTAALYARDKQVAFNNASNAIKNLEAKRVGNIANVMQVANDRRASEAKRAAASKVLSDPRINPADIEAATRLLRSTVSKSLLPRQQSPVDVEGDLGLITRAPLSSEETTDSAADTATAIQNNKGRTEFERRLAKVLHPVLQKLGTKFVVVRGPAALPENLRGQPVFAGLYDSVGNTVYLDAEQGTDVGTALHEFVHVASVDVIDTYYENPESLSVEAQQAVKEMQELMVRAGGRYAQLKQSGRATPDLDLVAEATDGFMDVKEFVAYGLTSNDMQEMLLSMPPTKQANIGGVRLSTAFSSFVNAIRKMLGIPGRDLSAFEQLLDLTGRVAQETMSGRATLSANLVFSKETKSAADAVNQNTPAANARFLQSQGDQLNKASKPPKNPAVRRTVNTVMGQGKEAVRKVLTWGLPLPALNDYVQSYLSKGAYEPFAASMQRFTDIAIRSEGEMRRFIDSITVQLARMGDWKRDNADKYQAFTDLYFGGSHAKVDLTKLRSAYTGNTKKLAEYDRLKKFYDSIGPSGQAIYKQMRAIHNRQFDQILDQVYNRVYSETQNVELATRLRNEFAQRMADKGPLEGYAPMLRPSGKYLLQYPVEGEEQLAFEVFSNGMDREARIQQLMTENNLSREDIRSFLSSDKGAFDGVVPTSFLGDVLAELKKGNVSDAVIESVMTMGVAVSPANLVMERLASRKETPGYVRDPFWAFQEGTLGLGRKLINIKYAAQTSTELRNMEAARRNVENDPNAAAIMEDVRKRAAYAANPSQSWWSNIATTGTYGWTLGFNASSAIVDMSSLALIVAPYLSRTYGMGKTYGAMLRATKDIMGMGSSADVETLATEGLEGPELQKALDTLGVKERDMVRRKTTPSMLNINFNDPVQAAKYAYLKPLVDKVRETGHSERYSELSELSEFGEGNFLSKLAARMGFMMSTSERLKREIGLKAAYDLQLSKVAPNGNPTQEQMVDAANKAMEMSLLLNGGSTAVTGARFQQGDISRIAFMYRRFAALQLYIQTKTIYDATSNDDPAVREAARGFAAQSMLTSVAFVGVKGAPMMGAVATLWAMMAAVFDDEDEDNSLEAFLRTNLNPVLVEGVPNILFNANVGERMELTNLLVRETNLPDDATAADILLAHFGGPAYGSIQRVIRGKQLIEQGEIQRGIESMLPVSVSNIFKSGRFLTEGAVETMRGDEVVEVTPQGALAQLMGFAPADYARAMQFKTNQAEVDRRMNQRRSSLLDAYYTAYRVGDASGMVQAVEAIGKFNQRYPNFGITNSQLKQSVSTRNRNTEEMVMGTLPTVRRRMDWLESAEDWGF